MEINRRQFSLLLTAGLMSPTLLASANKQGNLYTSAAKVGTDQYALIVTNDKGDIRFQHALPSRAHHVEAHPHRSQLAVIARRPGTFIDIVDYNTSALIKRIETKEGQHLFGHGIFTPDGHYLVTTENDIRNQHGLIVIRDAKDDYRIVKQFHSAGIGPHELKLMHDGKTLVVANGGILTHPDKGRAKLNVDTMTPSLAYFELATGQLLEQVFLPDEYHKLSIRHFDINANGNVVIGLQYEGEKFDDVPLVAFHRRNEPLQLVRAPDHINYAMKHYCGSARFDTSGNIAAISSPKGNLITFWSADGQFLTQIKSRDGCGVSATDTPNSFLITTGTGQSYRYDINTGRKDRLIKPKLKQLSWDNHLTDLKSMS